MVGFVNSGSHDDWVTHWNPSKKTSKGRDFVPPLTRPDNYPNSLIYLFPYLCGLRRGPCVTRGVGSCGRARTPGAGGTGTTAAGRTAGVSASRTGASCGGGGSSAGGPPRAAGGSTTSSPASRGATRPRSPAASVGGACRRSLLYPAPRPTVPESREPE